MKEIQELLKQCEEYWARENAQFFGVLPMEDLMDDEDLEDALLHSVNRFWKHGTCELKELMEQKLCKDWDRVNQYTFHLVQNGVNHNLGLYAEFDHPQKGVVEVLLSTIPYPTRLGWKINGSEYVLRVALNRDYLQISKQNGNVYYPGKKQPKVKLVDGEMTIAVDQEKLSVNQVLDHRSVLMLEAILDEELNWDNLQHALELLPELDKESTLYFQFEHTDAVLNVIRNSKRFANPEKGIPFDACSIMKSSDRGESEDSFKHLVLSQGNRIFTLENIRTAIFKSQSYNSVFQFTDTKYLFDAFKTSTNKSSGRSRLLLDDVTMRDGVAYRVVNGVEYNQFQMVFQQEKIGAQKSISCMSSSAFSANNDPKRIMMSAKLRAQAVPVVGEDNELLHTVPARVVFGELEGYSYGDSIIISESFARKLQSTRVETVAVDKRYNMQQMLDKYQVGDVMDQEDFLEVYNGKNPNRVINFRNIRIQKMTKHQLQVLVDIPFFVGDKLTNFHASKGIVSLILPDEEMPYLKNDVVVGDRVFPAGPFEVIISGLSVFRRKSMGQIFEAFASAMGYDDVQNAQDAIAKYRKEMQEFSQQSVVVLNGKETVKPCGVNAIIRLNHDAVTKQTLSDIKLNYKNLLKFEEMAVLNLAARGYYHILNELDVRGCNKHKRAFQAIQHMQETGEYEEHAADNLVFKELLKALGYDMKTDAQVDQSPIDPRMRVLSQLATNQRVNIFEEEVQDLENQVQ